jgi:hypothetical protein
MERLLLSQKNGTKPKQKQLTLPISELNGTFTFIPVKNWNKTKVYGIFITKIGTKWNVCICSSKNRNETKAKRIYITNFGTKWNVRFYSRKYWNKTKA